MSEKRNCCKPGELTTTQLTSPDQLDVRNTPTPTGAVSEEQVEEDNLLINPDPESMDSRG